MAKTRKQDPFAGEAGRERGACEARQRAEPGSAPAKLAPMSLTERGDRDGTRCALRELDREAMIPQRAFARCEFKRGKASASRLAEDAEPLADRLQAAAS